MCNLYIFSTSEKALERDNFMSPEEAKAFGVVDHVLEHPITPPPSEEGEEGEAR